MFLPVRDWPWLHASWHYACLASDRAITFNNCWLHVLRGHFVVFLQQFLTAIMKKIRNWFFLWGLKKYLCNALVYGHPSFLPMADQTLTVPILIIQEDLDPSSMEITGLVTRSWHISPVQGRITFGLISGIQTGASGMQSLSEFRCWIYLKGFSSNFTSSLGEPLVMGAWYLGLHFMQKIWIIRRDVPLNWAAVGGMEMEHYKTVC